MPAQAYDIDLGNEFGKPDLERLGLFVDGPYMNGTRYQFQKQVNFKGTNFFSVGYRSKCGTTHGYFDTEFKRAFEGEGRPIKKAKDKEKDKIPFVTGYKGKKHSTPGDYFGTFQKFDEFSPVKKPKPPYKSLGANFLSNNGKKGGPGYINITIAKYPEHSVYRYGEKPVYRQFGQQLNGPFVSSAYPKPYFSDNPFSEDSKVGNGPTYVVKPEKTMPFLAGHMIPNGPAKWQGGSHAGCFDTFPEFKPCKYVSMAEANKPFITSKGQPVFNPQSTAEKSMFTRSVLTQITDIAMNSTNYKTYKPKYLKYLADYT